MQNNLDDNAHLRVSAHVLVQLGSELVTDVEQALLECVKNAYDADSPGCRIEVDTRAEGVVRQQGVFGTLGRHKMDAENVHVAFLDSKGEALDTPAADQVVERTLSYTGRITVVDRGAGISPDRIRGSWLMISGSQKRTVSDGPKEKTKLGRTPLGDKGLGRLGTMKLGDILQVESSVSPDADVSVAQFRWKDCETAEAVDDVPVHAFTRPNRERLKGTRVSVLGLNDLADWRRTGRINEIARSLAKLVSPFEATSTFPVAVTLDGEEHSLLAVTDQVLSQAVAEFQFRWSSSKDGSSTLHAVAKFKKNLFVGGGRSENSRDKAELVFGSDDGDAFLASLSTFSRTKGYKRKLRDGAWLVTLEKEFSYGDLFLKDGSLVEDPGSFDGAFYFFHLDNLDTAAASGIAVNKALVKNMAGISILRDGFQVRSQSDWLELAAGMTSGSTYHMRFNNTLGYFSLSGEENYKLTEKSDREGFVEDAYYRGFHAIATACRKFSNDALEAFRRAFDAFAKGRSEAGIRRANVPSEESIAAVADTLQIVDSFKSIAEGAIDELKRGVASISQDRSVRAEGLDGALSTATSAIEKVASLHERLRTSTASVAFDALRQERDEQREQIAALLESAAVGLSARGLAHELRAHLSDIRYRLTQISKAAEHGNESASVIQAHVKAIRSSCSAIMSAASLIDPMLPRSRAIRDEFDLYDFLIEYVTTRKGQFDREGVVVNVTGRQNSVGLRVNRPRMLQVLENLVNNSLYWLRRAEHSGQLQGEKAISIEILPTGYTVYDSGAGVEPLFEDSLFEIFVTAKPDRDTGQGLGLFISKQLLAVDGCDISLDYKRNVLGRRYRFDVNLTAVQQGG